LLFYIFEPYDITWEVTEDLSIKEATSWDIEGATGGVITTGDAFLSEYSVDQLSLQSYYKNNGVKYDASSVVVFLFGNSVEPAEGITIDDATKVGDMLSEACISEVHDVKSGRTERHSPNKSRKA
jgi:hypothetical protein